MLVSKFYQKYQLEICGGKKGQNIGILAWGQQCTAVQQQLLLQQDRPSECSKMTFLTRPSLAEPRSSNS